MSTRILKKVLSIWQRTFIIYSGVAVIGDTCSEEVRCHSRNIKNIKNSNKDSNSHKTKSQS